MSKDRKVIYEPHPVTLERKKELVGNGYKIIDERFRPAGATIEQVSGATREGLDNELLALPGDHDNPDHVVEGLRKQYGAIFTDEDEEFVRGVVKAPQRKPSHGLRIDAIKAELTEKGIEFSPDAERDDLAKLLDEAE